MQGRGRRWARCLEELRPQLSLVSEVERALHCITLHCNALHYNAGTRRTLGSLLGRTSASTQSWLQQPLPTTAVHVTLTTAVHVTLTTVVHKCEFQNPPLALPGAHFFLSSILLSQFF